MGYFRKRLKNLWIALQALKTCIKLTLIRNPTLLVFTFHRILPQDDPLRSFEQPGMVATPENLQGLMQLMKRFRIRPVEAETWLENANTSRDLPRLSYAITLDDGWRDNYTHALPILVSEAVPATIFLVSRLIGTEGVYWPEQIIYLLTEGIACHPGLFSDPESEWLADFARGAGVVNDKPATIAQADKVVTRLKSLSDEEILRRLDRLRTKYPKALPDSIGRLLLNHEEIKEMEMSGLVSFGAHSRHHFRANHLDDEDAIIDEFVGCKEDLEKLLANPVKSFCYPNGNLTDAASRLVRTHYFAGFTTRYGWNDSHCDPYEVRRYNLHDGNAGSPLSLLALLAR